MSDEAIDSYNINGLAKLMKALKVDQTVVARVGILGDASREASPKEKRVGILGDASREASPKEKRPSSNAEIGAVHEFGSIKKNIKPRSFLRMPISTQLQGEMDRCGLFTKERLDRVLAQGSLRPWVEDAAKCAEAVVSDAFDTGGFGQWPAWANPNYTNNGGQLLVDTKQLRDSVTSEVL